MFPSKVLGALLSLAHLISIAAPEADAATRPNVIVILADDLGWSDTNLYGTTKLYRTPNIDRLAKRGMTFTHAYSTSPLCSPTRSSLMTGLSPARTGITAPNCHLPQVSLYATPGNSSAPNQKAILPNSATRLTTEHFTLAEMFKENGYATGHFGKWHLGAPPYSPLEHGFDVDVPHWPGPGPAGSYVAPWKFPDFDPQTPNEHIEDRMANEAVSFIEKHKDSLFFMNYWMFSVHAPFDAKRALIDEYQKVVDLKAPQRSPIYAAMVESMDDAIGTLLDTLDRLQIADNTIIVFASDNGGNMYNDVEGTTATSNAPLRGGKATMYEGGVRTPAVIVCPKITKAGSRSDAVIQTSDYYPTLLDLLAIAPQAKQHFDGISIVPALRGETLARNAIFTFFPHSPGVPDWLPAAISVHQSNWKLIRIFHGGDNASHRWKLFNLKSDLGETHDLVAEYPERVKAMDALIEAFLKDTKAVLPIPNPKFDPSKYQIEREGKATLKGGADSSSQKSTDKNAPAKKTKPIGQPVAGWQPSRTCTLSLKDGSLIVTSDGGDPHLSFVLPAEAFGSPLTMRFTMTSNSKGQGQLFWKEKGVAPAFSRERSTTFEVEHDNQAHDYSIRFTPDKPINSIRIDPSTSSGVMQISNMRLTTKDGMLLYQWKQ
ncbi:MAG: sulfatase [Pirellulaceae bacterium]|nr:sulfatase [Pirellulaceae bacterium]